MMESHPENDPSLRFDVPEELAHELDFMHLDHEEHTVKWVLGYVVMIPVLTCIVGFAIALLSRGLGGPLCDAGLSTWICSRAFEIAFPVIPGLVALAGTLGAALMTYLTWKRGQRWAPWLASIWALMPFTLAWMTAFGTMAILGHR